MCGHHAQGLHMDAMLLDPCLSMGLAGLMPSQTSITMLCNINLVCTMSLIPAFVDEDGGRVHDLLGTRCDPYVRKLLTGQDFHFHCHSNLTRAVLPFGLTEFDVHDVLNVFQCTGEHPADCNAHVLQACLALIICCVRTTSNICAATGFLPAIWSMTSFRLPFSVQCMRDRALPGIRSA